MTDHIYYGYKCTSCKEPYMPLEVEQRKCPKCSTVGPEGAPSIADILHAARTNISFGAFVPLSPADLYVAIAYQTLIKVEKNGNPTNSASVDAICEEEMRGMDFSSGEHQRPHAKAFLKALLTEAYLPKGQ